MANLKEYLPTIYKDILETDVLTSSENILFDELASALLVGQNNQFILTADARGLTEYEKIVGITPQTDDTLEDRRRRILNRFSTTQVFTMRSLEQKLNELVGVGTWKAYMDTENPYTLIVESSATNQKWYSELLITINTSKPANILFINKPLVSNYIKAKESISHSKRLWNYRLGTTWNLVRLPFISIHDLGDLSMSGQTIKEALLNGLANFTVNDIAKVRINGSYIISDFTEKQSNQNIATIQYIIPLTAGLSEVTKVEFLDAENNVLTDTSVYIPALTDLVLKHSITVKEG